MLSQNKFLSAGVQEASPHRGEVLDLLTGLRRKECCVGNPQSLHNHTHNFGLFIHFSKQRR